jgi:hypothetical protein
MALQAKAVHVLSLDSAMLGFLARGGYAINKDTGFHVFFGPPDTAGDGAVMLVPHGKLNSATMRALADATMTMCEDTPGLLIFTRNLAERQETVGLHIVPSGDDSTPGQDTSPPDSPPTERQPLELPADGFTPDVLASFPSEATDTPA